ncbi:hypothetical protein DTO027B6_6332 [Paecilomyces variotii]|nr:hypothetical protein DTO032I3_5487 [Paecilomyces variotii]KAJ9341060.1 hypothetical protein DTO027B6_6332 [Paecilomyces variotii]KAJ9347857.1 hypothetical protein DTO027B9_8772 [Paecilomyces variotii]
MLLFRQSVLYATTIANAFFNTPFENKSLIPYSGSHLIILCDKDATLGVLSHRLKESVNIQQSYQVCFYRWQVAKANAEGQSNVHGPTHAEYSNAVSRVMGATRGWTYVPRTSAAPEGIKG